VRPYKGAGGRRQSCGERRKPEGEERLHDALASREERESGKVK